MLRATHDRSATPCVAAYQSCATKVCSKLIVCHQPVDSQLVKLLVMLEEAGVLFSAVSVCLYVYVYACPRKIPQTTSQKLT